MKGTIWGQLAFFVLLILAAKPHVALASDPTGLLLAQPDRTTLAEDPQALPDFSLTNQEGRPFRFSELLGQSVLLFFGFTNCPNVCPPTMQKLRQVQRSLDHDSASLTTVFVSVDGERDTPTELAKYLEPFMPGFVGLTGDPRKVRGIAAGFSAVFFKEIADPSAKAYNVEHSSQVYLVDRTGRLRATFFNAPADDMLAVTRLVATEVD